MTLHFHWMHAPRWPAHRHVNRAMTLVLGVIGVSLLFGALRVVDAGVSGALVETPATVVVPTSARVPAPGDAVSGTEPVAASAPIDAVEVPDATAEAISL
jgi:hypothetical protein